MPLMQIIQKYGDRFQLTVATGRNTEHRHETKWCHSKTYYRARSGLKLKIDPYIDMASVPIGPEKPYTSNLQKAIEGLSKEEREQVLKLLNTGG